MNILEKVKNFFSKIKRKLCNKTEYEVSESDATTVPEDGPEFQEAIKATYEYADSWEGAFEAKTEEPAAENILDTLTREKLLNLARKFNITGLSRARKNEIYDRLQAYIKENNLSESDVQKAYFDTLDW
jgi:hypothetical protein